jgi:hypothetical protein
MPGDRLPDRDADLDHRAGVDDLGGSGRHRLRQVVKQHARLHRRRDGLLVVRVLRASAWRLSCEATWNSNADSS